MKMSISIRHQKPARDVESDVSSGKLSPHSSRIGRRTSASPNIDIAGRLDEVANIFAEQGANRFRVQAYRHAANVLRRLPRSVADIFNREGIEGLEKIRVSVRALPGRFATSFSTAGSRCSIVSAAKARRLPFSQPCLALEKNLRDVSMTISESKRWRNLKSQLTMDASKISRHRRKTTSWRPRFARATPWPDSSQDNIDADATRSIRLGTARCRFRVSRESKSRDACADRTASFQSGRRILASHSSHGAKRASLHGAVLKYGARS